MSLLNNSNKKGKGNAKQQGTKQAGVNLPKTKGNNTKAAAKTTRITGRSQRGS
jgi:hypothetical protein